MRATLPPLEGGLPRESGTVLKWWKDQGFGIIKSDSGGLLKVHSVDILVEGAGKRSLPVGHECEYERCKGVDGEERAAEVTRPLGRYWNLDGEGHPGGCRDYMQYFCILETDYEKRKGILKYFNSEELYACIIEEEGNDVFVDHSHIKKNGSYMCVRRGVEVEYTLGLDAKGRTVATNVYAADGKSINVDSKRSKVVYKRIKKSKKRRHEPLGDTEQLKINDKNPVSVMHEFGSRLKPQQKAIVFKLVDTNGDDPTPHTERTRGVKTSFSIACYVDGTLWGTGVANAKKAAKRKAAEAALEALSAHNPAWKQSIQSIQRPKNTQAPQQAIQQKIRMEGRDRNGSSQHPLSRSKSKGPKPGPPSRQFRDQNFPAPRPQHPLPRGVPSSPGLYCTPTPIQLLPAQPRPTYHMPQPTQPNSYEVLTLSPLLSPWGGMDPASPLVAAAVSPHFSPLLAPAPVVHPVAANRMWRGPPPHGDHLPPGEFGTRVHCARPPGLHPTAAWAPSPYTGVPLAGSPYPGGPPTQWAPNNRPSPRLQTSGLSNFNLFPAG